MLVSTLINRVRYVLQDVNQFQRWSDQVLLDCFNEAQFAMVQNRPDTMSEIVPYFCLPRGKQDLTGAIDNVYRLLDVFDNEVSGRTITKTQRDTLDNHDPNWSVGNGTPAVNVEQYVYDEKSPSVFYVYPVPAVGHQINLLVSKRPVTVLLEDIGNTDIEVDEIYVNSLMNFMLFRAYMTDAETEGNMTQAQMYLKMFANDLQLTWNIALMFSQPIQGDTDG